MNEAPQSFSYESMGTGWAVTIWDDIGNDALEEIRTEVIVRSQTFDQTYSRFIKNSLVWKLAAMRGSVEVPEDLVAMLRIYKKLNALSGGKLNPFIGHTISDLGYDAEYSLKKKDAVRKAASFDDVVTILDDTHLELKQEALIDLGALGKGYFVDKLAAHLSNLGLKRFLVNGSGDIVYRGNGTPLRAGLEHPDDPKKVIGVIHITDGALCASAGNRRTWGEYNHTIDPDTLSSPKEIIADWVMADSAALADGLCTCLMLTDPERYSPLSFEYCLLHNSYHVKRSAGFAAELF